MVASFIRILIYFFNSVNMDVFSHGLWSGVLAKGSNTFKHTRLNPWLAAWWGIFPDVFAFAIPTVWLLFGLLSGTLDPALLRRSHSEEPPAVFTSDHTVFQLAAELYHISHSLVIFALVFGGILLIKKLLSKEWSWQRTPPWELLAWGLHILCDIPTHRPEFYPTPLFWPISNWKFTHGFSWGAPWFLLLDYGLLLLVFIIIKLKKTYSSH